MSNNQTPIKVCKHFVNGNCSNGTACEFQHINDICSHHFFGKCKFGDQCKLSHQYKLKSNNKNQNKKQNFIKKNTESFDPFPEYGDMRVMVGNPTTKVYNHIIKSQDYELFFWSISKICSKQDFLINYWINKREQITHIQKIQYKILKKISLNIYNINLINKIIKYIESIYFNKHKLILDKILDILKNNKITYNNLKY